MTILSIIFSFRWHLESLGLQSIVLTNNPAESLNATFKRYLHLAGPPTNNLNHRQTYEVLLGCKFFLESEFQNVHLANYQQGDFELKDLFKNTLQGGLCETPHYIVQTPKEIVKEINKNKRGKNVWMKKLKNF